MKKAMISRKELFFQIVLHILVLLFYSFDKYNPGITFAQLVFFLVYTIFAAFITYFLMPRLLYRKKYWQFLGMVVLVLFGVIWAEELLEMVFYPGTKRATPIFCSTIWTIFIHMPLIIPQRRLPLFWNFPRYWGICYTIARKSMFPYPRK